MSDATEGISGFAAHADPTQVLPGTCGACEHGPHGDSGCPMGREHVTQDSMMCVPMDELSRLRARVAELEAESAKWKRAAEWLASRYALRDLCRCCDEGIDDAECTCTRPPTEEAVADLIASALEAKPWLTETAPLRRTGGNGKEG